MILLLVILLRLVQSVHGTQTNSTTLGLPQPSGDGVPRTTWGILSSCAVTLLICVWHAIHFDIHYDPDEWLCKGHMNLQVVLWAIFGPELVVSRAVRQWWEARCIVAEFREKGYEWSMTHSFFAEMGGFDYRDEEGHRTTAIHSFKFLDLCEQNKIANPLITVREIRDKSKSDALAKAIFAVQLLWFVIQAIARSCFGLAVTLIELDTVSMAALALLILWFWWDKPHSPKCPHVFYSPQNVRADPQMANNLKNVWKPEPSYMSTLLSFLGCIRDTRLVNVDAEMAISAEGRPVHSMTDRLMVNINDFDLMTFSLSATWLLLGGLHLIAWDFHFVTEMEKVLWRIASLVLTGGSIVSFAAYLFFTNNMLEDISAAFFLIALGVGIVSRVLLMGLMLASLQALPPSAYETIAWTAYIPHL